MLFSLSPPRLVCKNFCPLCSKREQGGWPPCSKRGKEEAATGPVAAALPLTPKGGNRFLPLALLLLFPKGKEQEQQRPVCKKKLFFFPALSALPALTPKGVREGRESREAKKKIKSSRPLPSFKGGGQRPKGTGKASSLCFAYSLLLPSHSQREQAGPVGTGRLLPGRQQKKGRRTKRGKGF